MRSISKAIIIRKHPTASSLLPFNSGELAGILQAMLCEAGYPDAGLELAIYDDAGMQALNMKALGLPGPTNILSFPFAGTIDSAQYKGAAPSAGTTSLLGWLALSAPTLLRECFLYGQDEREHCIRLLAHGVTHILGHDHGPAMDAVSTRLESAGRNSMLP